MYLMLCTLCHLRYIGKAETQFNIRLNNPRKDAHKKDSPQADQHFRLPNHKFNQNVKFILIEQLHNINIDKELATCS